MRNKITITELNNSEIARNKISISKYKISILNTKFIILR